MLSRLFIKFILFIVSWVISGLGFFIAIFSACADGKIHEKMLEGTMIFYRFIYSSAQLFITSKDVKKLVEAVSVTFNEIMNRLAVNIEKDYVEVLVVFASTYLAFKMVAGLISILRRKIKIRGITNRNSTSSGNTFGKFGKSDNKQNKEQVNPADKTIVVSGGY